MWALEADKDRGIALLEERVKMDTTQLDVLRHHAKEALEAGVQIYEP